MANVFLYSTHWEGTSLQPGSKHYWWWTVSTQVQNLNKLFKVGLNVTAHPLVWGPYTPPPPVELTVENLRTGIAANNHRRVWFTVHNTGPNPVVAYSVNLTYITN